MYTRHLNNEVKGNRALLLLLPPDVVDGVKVRPSQCGSEWNGFCWYCLVMLLNDFWQLLPAVHNAASL